MGKGVKAQLSELNDEVVRLHDQALALFASATEMEHRGEPEQDIQAKVDEANELVEESRNLSEQIQVLHIKQSAQLNLQITAVTLAIGGIVIATVLST